MELVVADSIDRTEHAGEDRSIANRFNGIANVGIDLRFHPKVFLIFMPEGFYLK
jgi:hypothetical protein